MSEPHQESLIPSELAGKRLDQALAEIFPDYSRARLQAWVKSGEIRVDNRLWRCRDKVQGGETIAMQLSESTEPPVFAPEALPLEILYADESLIVLNKASEMVVHPAAGN